jgi:carboxypeptidase Taq
MPIGGAGAWGRQHAALSRLAHDKSVDSTLAKLLDELEPYAADLPTILTRASLIRVAKRDFERAIKVPSDHVARSTAFGAEARGL